MYIIIAISDVTFKLSSIRVCDLFLWWRTDFSAIKMFRKKKKKNDTIIRKFLSETDSEHRKRALWNHQLDLGVLVVTKSRPTLILPPKMVYVESRFHLLWEWTER